MHSVFAENLQFTEVELGWVGSLTGWVTITIREYLLFAQARILNREFERATSLRHGRNPEVNISPAWAVVSPRF